jgi:hypothetical protein
MVKRKSYQKYKEMKVTALLMKIIKFNRNISEDKIESDCKN